MKFNIYILLFPLNCKKWLNLHAGKFYFPGYLYITLFNLGNILKAEPLHPSDKGRREKCFWPECFVPRFDIRWAGAGVAGLEEFNQGDDWRVSTELNIWVKNDFLGDYPMICKNFSCASASASSHSVLLCASPQRAANFFGRGYKTVGTWSLSNSSYIDMFPYPN